LLTSVEELLAGRRGSSDYRIGGARENGTYLSAEMSKERASPTVRRDTSEGHDQLL